MLIGVYIGQWAAGSPCPYLCEGTLRSIKKAAKYYESLAERCRRSPVFPVVILAGGCCPVHFAKVFLPKNHCALKCLNFDTLESMSDCSSLSAAYRHIHYEFHSADILKKCNDGMQ